MKTKREEILAVALDLFNKKDIDGVTTRDIAKISSRLVFIKHKNNIFLGQCTIIQNLLLLLVTDLIINF